ncbi:MAG: hypothetical protein ACJARX_001496 [Psychroserpens sp.]|jgi:hypothetical protein|uniref:hypothetical protein n=1 Tax=Psychroserpens sp. TaxID=2020870 RepID=UPI0039E22FFD
MSKIKKKGNIIAIVKEYYWIAIIPFFIYGLISSIESKDDINQHQTETFGTVYRSSPIAKHYSKRSYKYKFNYNTKTHFGSSVHYQSENIKIGSFYKVEFSKENPNHNRMIFDIEYLQKIKFDDFRKAFDPIYVSKNLELKKRIEDVIESYEIETN